MNKNSISDTDNKKIQNKIVEVQKKFDNQHFLSNYILETLGSFAFRYLDEPFTFESVSKDVLRVLTVEKGIKEAIKIKNSELRNGISELVKRVSKEQGPTILREIKIITDRSSRALGKCEVFARISFGHPEHDFATGTFIEKMESFNFDDEIHFRNILAKHLEVVCELF
ncbi:MAG: hypothetical protein Q7U04_12655 [Bacteriovorax sp.]|nr:hypothetical protein [Bacteriovorax sp.]